MASPWDFTSLWYERFTVSEFPTFEPAPTGVDGLGTCKYLAAGQVRKMVTTISGLDHLEGQSVSIVQDGTVSIDTEQEVIGGVINLTVPAAVVHVGLPYTGKVQFLPLGGDGQTVNETKKRKVYDVVFRLFQSLGGKFGKDEDKLYTLAYDDQLPEASPLFTGDFHDVPFESEVDDDWSPVIVIDTPLPFMLLAAVIRSEIDEDK